MSIEKRPNMQTTGYPTNSRSLQAKADKYRGVLKGELHIEIFGSIEGCFVADMQN